MFRKNAFKKLFLIYTFFSADTLTIACIDFSPLKYIFKTTVDEMEFIDNRFCDSQLELVMETEKTVESISAKVNYYRKRKQQIQPLAKILRKSIDALDCSNWHIFLHNILLSRYDEHYQMFLTPHYNDECSQTQEQCNFIYVNHLIRPFTFEKIAVLLYKYALCVKLDIAKIPLECKKLIAISRFLRSGPNTRHLPWIVRKEVKDLYQRWQQKQLSISDYAEQLSQYDICLYIYHILKVGVQRVKQYGLGTKSHSIPPWYIQITMKDYNALFYGLHAQKRQRDEESISITRKRFIAQEIIFDEMWQCIQNTSWPGMMTFKIFNGIYLPLPKLQVVIFCTPESQSTKTILTPVVKGGETSIDKPQALSVQSSKLTTIVSEDHTLRAKEIISDTHLTLTPSLSPQDLIFTSETPTLAISLEAPETGDCQDSGGGDIDGIVTTLAGAERQAKSATTTAVTGILPLTVKRKPLFADKVLTLSAPQSASVCTVKHSCMDLSCLMPFVGSTDDFSSSEEEIIVPIPLRFKVAKALWKKYGGILINAKGTHKSLCWEGTDGKQCRLGTINIDHGRRRDGQSPLVRSHFITSFRKLMTKTHPQLQFKIVHI